MARLSFSSRRRLFSLGELMEKNSRGNHHIQRIGPQLHRDGDAPVTAIDDRVGQPLGLVAKQQRPSRSALGVPERLGFGIVEHGGEQFDVPFARKRSKSCNMSCDWMIGNRKTVPIEMRTDCRKNGSHERLAKNHRIDAKRRSDTDHSAEVFGVGGFGTDDQADRFRVARQHVIEQLCAVGGRPRRARRNGTENR